MILKHEIDFKNINKEKIKKSNKDEKNSKIINKFLNHNKKVKKGSNSIKKFLYIQVKVKN